MKTIDFAVGWPIVDDNESIFVNTLKSECQLHKLSFLLVDENQLDSLDSQVKEDKLKIKFYLDMASDVHNSKDEFTRFTYCLKDSGTRIVDDPDDVKAAADKSITHFDLVRSKVMTPYTVVIRNWEPTRKLTEEEEKKLGVPFIIKPALGYGHRGVKTIDQKHSLKEIAEARKFIKGDNFLLQEIINPLQLDGSPAWFRVYHLFGEIIPCWWDPQTHVYRQVSLKEMDSYNLLPMIRSTSEIARITRIDWFSCEISIDKKKKEFVVIDYMNDQCAIDPQSQRKDGVPDDLIVHIATRIIDKAWQYIIGRFTLTHRAIWFPKIKVKDEDN